MIAILSPARNSRAVERGGLALSRPAFMAEAVTLAEAVRTHSPYRLESLLDVNAKRAFELYDDYQAFDGALPGSPALLAYYGAAYRAMRPETFTGDDFAFAQDHLRILSALYGLLRPLDGILPHRLGMRAGVDLIGRDLYDFWGDKVYRELTRAGEPIIGLASMDYLKMILPHLTARDNFINCRFLVQRPDGVRATVATVRAARGLMARYIIENRIDRVEGLIDFDQDGYRFAPFRSDGQTLIFIKG